MQWCYSGSAEWADDMVDTTFFLSLPWSRARTSYFYLVHISGAIMHGRHKMGNILFVGWCNVTAICWNLCFLFMSTLARPGGDGIVVTSTKSDLLLLHCFAIPPKSTMCYAMRVRHHLYEAHREHSLIQEPFLHSRLRE
jgi:hypothetical protein